MNSKDPTIRLMQAKLRSYGPRKKYMAEFQKKDLPELLNLKSKGQDFISKALSKMIDNPDPEFEEKFDEFISRFEALEDVIYQKTNA